MSAYKQGLRLGLAIGVAAFLMLAAIALSAILDPVKAGERSWTGGYVGATGAYSAAVLGDALGSDGPGAAVVAGYDLQSGKLVVGPWAEYGWHWRDWAGIDVDVKGWAVGARAGVLVTPRSLVYVTGGYTDVDWSLAGAGSTNGTGWLGGGGVELDLGAGFYGRGEYRYTRLELDAFPSVDDNIQEGRMSLVYKFNMPGLSVPSFEAKPIK